MKKLILVTISVLILFIIGCQSEEEKTNEQIRNLTSLAEDYYNEGKLEKAIDTYEEILSLKNTDEIRKKVSEIEEEIANAQKANDFLTGLYNIEKEKLRSGISVSASDMEYIMKDIKKLIDEFENIDTSADNDINKFIESIRADDSFRGYQYLKEEVNNQIYTDGGTTDLLGELDSSFDVFSSSVMALNRQWVLESIQKITSIEIPNKYSSVIK
jgi:tetratricopeptide (TPR) repeat protein